MNQQKNSIGVLQGRLTPSKGRGIQFFPFETWRDEFETASQIGFDSIELLVKKDSYDKNPLWTSEGIAEIKALQKRHTIATPSVHGFTLQTPDYPEIFSTLIERAHEVGARTVLASFFDDNVISTPEAKEQAYIRLQKPVQIATDLGMKIGIETELPAQEVMQFIDRFSSPAVGVYYDIGNMVSMDVSVVEEIHLLGTLICGVHIKDRLRNHGESVPLGEGDSDFPAILTALKEIGYDGDFIMQGARSENIDDISLNKRYYQYIEAIERTL